VVSFAADVDGLACVVTTTIYSCSYGCQSWTCALVTVCTPSVCEACVLVSLLGS
jgi:hypothetical protein